MMKFSSASKLFATSILLLATITLILAGCGDRYTLAPVHGKVLYRGKPLEFGSITFRPGIGPSARGKIQADGTFSLKTDGWGEGAILGKHLVRVACYENQNPQISDDLVGDPGPGRLLIPPKYTFAETSGLVAEVKQENTPFVFELTD